VFIFDQAVMIADSSAGIRARPRTTQ